MTACALGFLDGFIFALGALTAAGVVLAVAIGALAVFLWCVDA